MSDPVDVHHLLDGPEDAPVLVLSNSLGTTHRMWDAQLAAFSERFRVLRYDTRGHGSSPVPPGPYTMADLGGDVIALLDRLGIERAAFCGVSLGGMTGMWLASNAPDRVDVLVPTCTAAKLGPASQWQERADTVRADGMAAIVDAVVERWVTPAASDDLVGGLRDMLLATPPEGYAGCCEAIRDMDLLDGLAAVRARTLVISAADDPATPPEHGRAIAERIPDARLTVLPDGRHLANVEFPERYNAAVLEELS